jgi:predicted Zn finger-like uncharacterized protein
MTSASPHMFTRCPKCGTAFRVTQSQLQSAKGAVRCGSCLNVFKAQEYEVQVKPDGKPTAKTAAAKVPASTTATSTTAASTTATPTATTANSASSARAATAPASKTASNMVADTASKPIAAKATTSTATVELPPSKVSLELKKPDFSGAPLTSTLDDSDDILISDDMDEKIVENESKYEFDGFMDIEIKPTSDISLFERKIRPDDEPVTNEADESWAEMLINEEEEEAPALSVARAPSEEELADEALLASIQNTSDTLAIPANPEAINSETSVPETAATTKTPSLVFSLIDEPQDQARATDEFELTEELAQIPDHQGFNASAITAEPEEPEFAAAPDETPSKRQLKTQPKIRAYDGSRAALLMNIIPAPIEFSAKTMRRWYQRKLWASLSIVALLALVAQIAWFKFDSLSRIEPYRTAYLFACPYLGCEVPTLIDTRLITTSNLVVREHPNTPNALAVDVMIINKALFDQPFPDLVLVFSDLDDKLVASRRFTPKDYLGGELAGLDLMPQNQKVYITLDLVDPGHEAVNYRIYIPQH